VKLPRRRFLRLALAASAAALADASSLARAQSYPTRPVRMVVGYPPGITPDIVTRLFAQSLSERLGQQFVVENRPGAASNIGTEFVVRASPDGYTLLTVTATNAINTTLFEKLSFDLVRDLAPVAGLIRSSNVLVVIPSVPAKTLTEFIAYAKANPAKINYASTGSGSATNVAGELFKSMTGINIVHVAYHSSYLPDLLGGQVQAAFAPIPQVIKFIKAGKLRALAVTGVERSDALPDVPAVAEIAPGYSAYVWDGLGAPKGTPADVIDTLNKEVGVILADPAMKSRLADLGAEPMPMSPAQFGGFLTDETEKWAKVIQDADIKPN
jgi:tripartite-type tricarboxylate transporter receptor subunit TctC